MSGTEESGHAAAARLATLPRALALDGTRLIGTMGAPGARRALVREASGEVRPVSRGDMVAGARIVEVEADALRLHTGARIARLELEGTGAGPAASPLPRARPETAAEGPRPRRRPDRGDA